MHLKTGLRIYKTKDWEHYKLTQIAIMVEDLTQFSQEQKQHKKFSI